MKSCPMPSPGSARNWVKETDPEIESLLSAAFARFGQEACARKKYKAVAELCHSFERVARQRPALVQDLRSRVGIENRLPEMIEEAINADQAPEDLVNVLQQLPRNSVEHLADRFFRAQKRVECDRIVELVGRTRTTWHRRSARNSAHRPAPPGCLHRRPVEPPRGDHAAGVAALPHERVQPLLSGRHRSPDRLRRRARPRTHPARTARTARRAHLARGHRRDRHEPGPQRQFQPDRAGRRRRSSEPSPVRATEGHRVARPFARERGRPGSARHRGRQEIFRLQPAPRIENRSPSGALEDRSPLRHPGSCRKRPRIRRTRHRSARFRLRDVPGSASAATNASCCRARSPPLFPVPGESRTSSCGR